MAGILKNKKIVAFELSPDMKARLAQEVRRLPYRDISCGGIVKILNEKFKKAKLSRTEVLLGKGIVVEGKDIRCYIVK
jgi:hypothetical protein